MQTASRTTGASGTRRSRPRPSPGQLVAVGCVALGAAALAQLASASPTSWELADGMWRALLVAACALAGSRARRWSLLFAAAAVLPFAGGVGLPVAAAAAVVALSMLALRYRHRVVGAAVGSAVGWAALHLVRPSLRGVTALIAAAALVPMLVSGYRRCRRRTRRVVTAGLSLGVLVLLSGLIGAGLFGLRERSRIEEAVELTSRAVQAVDAEDPEAALLGFERAAEHFEQVRDATRSPWLLPARLTPGLGSNVEVLRVATDVGARLARVAGNVAETVDQEALRAPQGGVDLVVLTSITGTVGLAVDEIDESLGAIGAARSSWLLPPVQDALADMDDMLHQAKDSAEIAELAVERLPALLGAEGDRRYLVLMGNPAETRDIGGHIGNWAELTVSGGRFAISELGQPYELSSPTMEAPPTLTPGVYPQSLIELRPQLHPQNWGGTADFPTVARLAAEIYPQVRPGRSIDGVLYADPHTFAALLHFTGPVTVPGTELTIGPDDAAEFLMSGQFGRFATEQEADQHVNALIDDVLRRFSTSRLPSPRRLGDVLGPMVEQGRLQFASLDPADTELLDRLGLHGAVERPGGGDLLGVMTRNTNPSKGDVYLRREVAYGVRWNPFSGAVEGSVTVTLRNEAPPDGLRPPVGSQIPGVEGSTNRTTVVVLSPHWVSSAQLDGEPVGVGTQQEFPGVRRHSVLVDIPAGATRVLELQLDGDVSPGSTYQLQWVGQPASEPGQAKVTIRSTTTTDGHAPARSFEFRGDTDALVSVEDH